MNPEREEGLYYPDGTYKSRNEIIKSNREEEAQKIQIEFAKPHKSGRY